MEIITVVNIIRTDWHRIDRSLSGDNGY